MVKAAHGVVVFEAEAERVDDGVAALAGLGAGEFGYFLAHRKIGREVSVLERDGNRRRLQAASNDVAGEENPAMNG